MKKRRKKLKIVSFLLSISLLVTAFTPFTVFAEEPSHEQLTDSSQLWTPEHQEPLPNTEGDLPLEELETAVLTDEDKPEIISEDAITEKGHVNRLWEQESDLNTIIFQNRDGKKTMYYFTEPVKYKDKDGNIKDKKNKLTEQENTYTNAENDINSYFPKKIHKNKGVVLRHNDIEIEVAPLINGSSGASRQTGQNKDNQPTEYVEYPAVFDESISVRYTPTFGGFKEDIILSENVGINEFTFRIKTNGLSLVSDEFGSYNLINPLTGQIIARIGSLQIYDSKPFEVPDEILNESISNPTEEDFAKKEQTLEELIQSIPLGASDGKPKEDEVLPVYNHHYVVYTVVQDEEYLITIVVDENYLTDSDRVWPVYVDPTINVEGSGDSKTIQDAPIYSGKPTSALGGNAYNVVGWQGSTHKVGRTLMKFPGLASNSTYKNLSTNQITSLDLHIYESSGKTASSIIDLYQYTGTAWTESTAKCNNIGWDSYSNNFTWNTINCSGWQTFNLLSMVATWKSSPTALDKGIMLKNYTSESDPTYSKHFDSTDTNRTTQDGVSVKPYLTFGYNPISYTTLSHGIPVNEYLEQGGEYWYTFTPTECDKTYVFYTTGSTDTYGELYQGTTLLESNDDSGDGNNFCISCSLVCGTQYRLKIRGYNTSTSGSYSVVVKSGETFNYNGVSYTVIGEDFEIEDKKEVTFTGTHIYANSKPLNSEHIRTINGQVYVCLPEIAPWLGLSVSGYVPGSGNAYPVQTTHTDVSPHQSYHHSYPYTQLEPCPKHGNHRFMVSLDTLMSDLHYTQLGKVSQISYRNSAKEIFIQGPGYFIAGQNNVSPLNYIASIELSLIPGVGDVKDVVDSVSGKDFMTGDTLAGWERVLSFGCALLPIVSYSGVNAGIDGIKGITKIDDVIDAADGLTDAARAAFRTNLWDHTSPLLRGIGIELDYADNILKATDGWFNIGQTRGGFYPVIDFVKKNGSTANTISMKTLDPRCKSYLTNNAPDVNKIKNAINRYATKYANSTVLIDGASTVTKELRMVVPTDYVTIARQAANQINVSGVSIVVDGF